MGEYTVTTIRTNKNGIETVEVEKRPVHIFRGDDGQMCTVFPKVTKLCDYLTVCIGKDKHKAISGRIEQITSGKEILRDGIATITIEVTKDKVIEYINSKLKQCFFDVECNPRYAECAGKQIDLNSQYYFGKFEPLENGNFQVNIVQR